MRHPILAALAVLAAAGMEACAGLQAATPAILAERADTDASLTYAAIASGVNAYEALPTTSPAQAAPAEALKVKAWAILSQERQAYALGRTFDLSGLKALVTQASMLGH